MFSSAASYMNPSERVRQQWAVFEQWVETVPRVAMEKEIHEAFQAMDAKWSATSFRTRPAKQDHEKSKATFRRELEDGLVTLAREEWQRRLGQAGLKDEDWGEMTFKETLAAERLLGGDLDEEGMRIMERVAQADEAEITVLPGLTSVARASNYSFVSPMSLSIGDDLDDDDDDTDGFESIYPFEIPASSGPESIADEIFDTTPSIPWRWNGDSSSYGIWSANTNQSSRQSSQTGSPERPPPKSMAAEHTFPRVAEPLPLFQAEDRTTPHKARVAGPRYIGPQLTDSDEVLDEEADFERFKMETRVTKIREFHEEAARADIQLAQDIYNARKTSRSWRDDEERKISEHEKRMVDLRRSKEEERKEIVRAERHKRREAIKQRTIRNNVPMGWGGAESPRQRLTQEVESKLKLGSAFVAPEPVMPTFVETRRDRRQSLSSTSSSQPPLSRSARQGAAPEPDRLAAIVSDLLDASISTSSSASISASSFTSASSTTSAQGFNAARWLPSSTAEVVKADGPAKPVRKKPSPPAVDLGASAPLTGATKKQVSASLAQGRTEAPPSTSSSAASAVDPRSTLPTSPPTVSKPVISRASSSAQASSKAQLRQARAAPPAPAAAKAPSPAAVKAPSPPVASKVPSPPVASKGPSPAASSKAPSPPAPSKGPSPPAAAKAPSPPAPSKGPSPPTAAKAPSPPTAASKGPSPPAPPPSKGPSPPALTKVQFQSAAASPPADTPTPKPKPTDPVLSTPALPLKKARAQAQAIETQTPGASSSRTTLEQMQRPFIHKSLGLGSDLWGSMPPPPAAPTGGAVWVSSSSAAKKAVSSSSAYSAQIEKSTSMPPPRLPLLAETIRPRRMSDPVSPSPRSFVSVDSVQELKTAPDALPRILKKAAKAPKHGKAKRVTIEEVSDEEDADALERLPVDSKIIFEPKPSVPQTMFSHIIDFESETAMTPTPPSAPAIPPLGPAIASDGKIAKEKHVRWTPSALGNGNGSPAARASLVDNNDELRAALASFETQVASPPNAGKKGGRGRSGSLQQTTKTDRKGKGKEKAVEPEPEEDDFARFMIGATQDLTQMRG